MLPPKLYTRQVIIIQHKPFMTFSVIFFLATHGIIGQVPFNEIVREVNRQIFDPDSDYPAGSSMQTNKFPKRLSGRVKSEVAVYPRNEKGINYFNPEGSVVKYEVYWNGKLNSNFSYEYADDGITLLKERGTYNLDYFHIDSNNYVGVNASENGKGFTFELDTLFIHESQYEYVFTRKSKNPEIPTNKNVFRYTRDGSLESVTTYKNNIRFGHNLNKYNEQNQVIEHQKFWNYSLFADEDDWVEFISNRVYIFSYDSIGFINSFRTELYNPVTRKWESQTQEFQCSLKKEADRYKSTCNCGQEDYFHLVIDDHGNWIRKEAFKNGELEISTRVLTYYD